MDESVARSFGRIEAQLDQVLVQVGRYGERLAEHGVRLGHVEAAVEELKRSKGEDVRQGMTLRTGLTVAAFSVMSSGLVGWLVPIITKGG